MEFESTMKVISEGCNAKISTNHHLSSKYRGGSGGGGGPPNFIKREKTSREHAKMPHFSTSYPDPPFPKSCIRP